MPIVCNADNLAIRHIEANDSSWHPLVVFSLQHDDHRFTVHFARRHSPLHRPAFIVPEVWRVTEFPKEGVGYLQASIRADKFSHAIPVTMVESLDVKA